MGIGGYINADPDVIEDTNPNRLVGGTLADVAVSLPKVAIAERLIRGLQPRARILSVQDDWHAAVDDLKRCDVILGAVDGFREREQLERFARKHLIPYIDIGMDVHELGESGFLVSGQVILSMPGAPCMRCCGFITDERLEQEAKHYGAAGSRPQVVWSNGVLASTAVGLLTQLLTPWYPNPPAFVFLDYDGNKGTVTRNARMDLLKDHVCPHHPPDRSLVRYPHTEICPTARQPQGDDRRDRAVVAARVGPPEIEKVVMPAAGSARSAVSGAVPSTHKILIHMSFLILWTNSDSVFKNSSTRLYGGAGIFPQPESDMTQELKKTDIEADFLQLARIALSGRTQDVHVILRRAAKRYHRVVPQFADALTSLLHDAPSPASPLRRQADAPLPVDLDSRLHLMRVETEPVLDHEPIFAPRLARSDATCRRFSVRASIRPARRCLLARPASARRWPRAGSPANSSGHS